jgi:uncharacterized membrane protein YvbJ
MLVFIIYAALLCLAFNSGRMFPKKTTLIKELEQSIIKKDTTIQKLVLELRKTKEDYNNLIIKIKLRSLK